MNNNTWHITPTDDLGPHVEISTLTGGNILINGEIRREVECPCKCIPVIKYAENDGIIIVHNSFDGWFVLGINGQPGQQITYHLPISKWEECSFAETLDKAPEFDGHTSADVLERLKAL